MHTFYSINSCFLNVYIYAKLAPISIDQTTKHYHLNTPIPSPHHPPPRCVLSTCSHSSSPSSPHSPRHSPKTKPFPTPNQQRQETRQTLPRKPPQKRLRPLNQPRRRLPPKPFLRRCHRLRVVSPKGWLRVRVRRLLRVRRGLQKVCFLFCFGF